MHSINKFASIARAGVEVTFSTCSKRIGREAPSGSYSYLTRYLPSCDKLLLEASSRSSATKSLVSDLAKGDWHAISERYSSDPDKLAVDGLKALKSEDIQTSQLSTLIFRWSLSKDYPDAKVHVISLFDETGNINPLADNFIRQTIRQSGYYSGTGAFLNEDQLSSFYIKMREKPPSEQVLFFTEVKEITGMPEEKTIIQRIQQVGNNIFNEFSYKGKYYEMTATFSMFQEFLNAYGGERDAVRIIPTFDMSTQEDIARNGVKDERDMALPFVTVKLAKKLDTFPAHTALHCIRHDFHHGVMATNIPPELRRAFIEYSEAILEEIARTDAPEIRLYLEALYSNIIDMDFPFFRRFNAPPLSLTHPLLSSRHIPDLFKSLFSSKIPHPTANQKFSGTLHAEFKRALERTIYENPHLLDGKEKENIDTIDIGKIKANIARTLGDKDFFSRYAIPCSYLV